MIVSSIYKNHVLNIFTVYLGTYTQLAVKCIILFSPDTDVQIIN